MEEVMIARQTKMYTVGNLILGIFWFLFGAYYVFFTEDKLVFGALYAIIASGYVLMSVYSRRNGFFKIKNGEIIRYEFPLKPKRIKINEINWASCNGSYYTLKSPTQQLSVELANVRNDDIPAFEKVLKEIVMSVPPYKRL